MSILPGADVLLLIEALKLFIGREIIITEMISRNRSGGYDRHHTTTSRFNFLADQVFGISFSGELLGIESKGGDNSYCFSIRSVVEFHLEAQDLIVTEHFEEETARLTSLTVADKSTVAPALLEGCMWHGELVGQTAK